ncbi:conserved domain protein [delta proteobacterium NaphS2]|nr:conserved domain protein [delta proteobacterium NaphS2]
MGVRGFDHVVLILSPVPVLRSKKHSQMTGEFFLQHISSCFKPSVERSLIGQKAQSLPLKAAPFPFCYLIKTGKDIFHTQTIFHFFENRPSIVGHDHPFFKKHRTSGTIMHKSKLPLSTWFWGAWLVTSHTPGMSALQFQKLLGLTRSVIVTIRSPSKGIKPTPRHTSL